MTRIFFRALQLSRVKLVKKIPVWSREKIRVTGYWTNVHELRVRIWLFFYQPISCVNHKPFFGDPGAVNGGGERLYGRKKIGEEKSFFRRFFFAHRGFSHPAPPSPTNCPWVFEDVKFLSTNQLGASISARYLVISRHRSQARCVPSFIE